MTKPEHIELLRQRTDWGPISVKLTRYAYACIRFRSWMDAEDIAQDAIAEAFDREAEGWNPDEYPEPFEYLKRAVSRLASIRRKSRGRNPIKRALPATLEKLGPTTAEDELALIHHQRAHLILTHVRERGDPKALAILDLLEANVLTMAEQTEHTQWTMIEVRNARRRLGDLLKKAEAAVDVITGETEKKEKFDA